jgi:hypothetical protein
MNAVRVTGTADPAEIAAVLAVVSATRSRAGRTSSYERWREARITALRTSDSEP